MTITTKITFQCGGATNGKPCNHTFFQEGANVTKHSTDVEARKAGWQWKSAKLQFCPDHKGNGKAKEIKAKAVVKKTAAGKTSKAELTAMVVKARKTARK
jgi:hypothetical protein